MFTGTKDPQSKEDFAIDWINRAATDHIVSSTWTAQTGLTVVGSNVVGGTKTQVRLSGGVAGKTLIVTNKVTLTSGQELEASIALRCEDA
jgi:hypothetical protein